MENNSEHIRGLITPARWDETGRPVQIALSTFDEEVYLIDDNEKCRELMKHIREEVEIQGKVTHKEGIKRIKVKSYLF